MRTTAPESTPRGRFAQHGLTALSSLATALLALCCALQFWVHSRQDYAASLDAYVALCGRGGSAPFQDLVRGAGLVSPFAPGALAGVVREAEAILAR